MNKKLYRPITLFACQNSSKQLKTPIWRLRCKAGCDLVNAIPAGGNENWCHSLDNEQWKYEHAMSVRKQACHMCEPLEIKALVYAGTIRFFCLPWTLAISRKNAESAFVDVDALAEFIIKHFQIKLKITP